MSLNNSRIFVGIIYLLLIIVGALLKDLIPVDDPVYRLLAIDILLTIVIALVGLLVKNDSIYDLYWSVIPFAMLIYWMDVSHIQKFNARVFILIMLLSWWSWRLSYNWFRGWKGLKHEDWRYVDLRKKTGIFYPLVSFLGIQLFPTLIVFGASLPMPAIFYSKAAFQLSDAIGGILMLAGILLEIFADAQMHDFRKNPDNRGKVIDTGLWKYSRHPNYLGEISFWWGVYVLSLATNSQLYLIGGPIIVTLLFVGISIPLMEKRMMKNKVDFKAYKKQTPVLVPWTWLKRKN